jgi:hypothetical protein
MSEERKDPASRLACWLNKDRWCGPDCVAYDPKGAQDTTGKHTSCLIIEHLHGTCTGAVTCARLLKGPASSGPPGRDLPPPHAGA